MADAGSTLNRRLTALGEREREQVDIDRALEALRGNRSASEEELAELQSRIGERLKVLGESASRRWPSTRPAFVWPPTAWSSSRPRRRRSSRVSPP